MPANVTKMSVPRVRPRTAALPRPRLRDVLDADITYRARRMANAGIAATIGELSPHLSLSPDGVLRFDPPGKPYELDLSGREFVLVPSVFAWPGTGMGWDPPSVIYPARAIFGLWEQGARSAGDLARLIGKTRAELLTALADPASTTGLAVRTGVPVSSVSEHLTVLRAAGLVATTRTGRFLTHPAHCPRRGPGRLTGGAGLAQRVAICVQRLSRS